VTTIYWQRGKRRRIFGTLYREMAKVAFWFAVVTVASLAIGIMVSS
jgi:hypothetical protein